MDNWMIDTAYNSRPEEKVPLSISKRVGLFPSPISISNSTRKQGYFEAIPQNLLVSAVQGPPEPKRREFKPSWDL